MKPFAFNGQSWIAGEVGSGAYDHFDPSYWLEPDINPGSMCDEMAQFMKRMGEFDSFVDVGALFGVFSLAFVHGRPNASAVAIEPSEWAFPVMQRHIAANDAILKSLEYSLYPIGGGARILEYDGGSMGRYLCASGRDARFE